MERSGIARLLYLKIMTTAIRIFFSKIKVEKTQFSYEIYHSGSQCFHRVSLRLLRRLEVGLLNYVHSALEFGFKLLEITINRYDNAYSINRK